MKRKKRKPPKRNRGLTEQRSALKICDAEGKEKGFENCSQSPNVNDEQKGAYFYGESGVGVHGGDTTKRQIGNYIYLDIQTVDNKTPIWYNLINYYIGACA